MKRGGELKRKTPLKQGSTPMKRTPILRGASTLKSAKPLARAVTPKDGAQPKPKKSSRGLKGRAPTAAEQRFMDQAGQQPCMACEIDGWRNHIVSLHHVDGRTKQGAHFQVLPLCSEHHMQDDSDPRGRVSVHGRKATFTARYGTERELLALLYARLGFIAPT